MVRHGRVPWMAGTRSLPCVDDGSFWKLGEPLPSFGPFHADIAGDPTRRILLRVGRHHAAHPGDAHEDQAGLDPSPRPRVGLPRTERRVPFRRRGDRSPLHLALRHRRGRDRAPGPRRHRARPGPYRHPGERVAWGGDRTGDDAGRGAPALARPLGACGDRNGGCARFRVSPKRGFGRRRVTLSTSSSQARSTILSR